MNPVDKLVNDMIINSLQNSAAHNQSPSVIVLWSWSTLSTWDWWICIPGLQLRKSEQNCFHDNFLISQLNPMMWPSLKSSLRDDSNEWNIIGFGWEIRKLAFWKLSILDLLYCHVQYPQKQWVKYWTGQFISSALKR